MYEKREAIKARIEQRIDEIRALTIKKRTLVDQWKFAVGDFLYPPVEGWQHCSNKHLWENTGEQPVWFETSLVIPERNDYEDLLLNAWFGGESLVFIDGKPFGELNPYHQTVNLNMVSDGKNHTISIQSVPHLLFGEKSKKRQFDHAHLLVIDKRIRRFADKLQICLETAFFSKDVNLGESLFILLEKTLKNTMLPRDTEGYTKTLMDNSSMSEYIQKKYCSEPLDHSLSNDLSWEQLEKMTHAEGLLDEGLKLLKGAFPPPGKISAVGHAHIDYAWLWPISETKRKIPRTFSNAISMGKRYDNFVFAQSSAQMYTDIANHYPEIMKEIKKMNKAGKWELVGGAWVEHDCNIPSPESLIRQMYYGQRYFKREFGSYCKIAWLPDVFGFPWTLPQILKNAGLDYFFTTKLTWNEKNPLPHDAMIWRGIDGSEVLYRSFKNNEGYNARLNPQTLLENWENYREKVKIPLSFVTFGYGDGGGGPSDEMMESYEILNDMPGLPQLDITSAAQHFKSSLEYTSQMETWDDELYLEFHRGTYTTQARTKKLHKDAEDSLILLEYLNSVLEAPEKYSYEKIDGLWENLLRNEFHDILPGSSIPEVYEDSERELTETWVMAKDAQKMLLQKHSCAQKDYLSVFNPSEYEQETTFVLEGKDAWLLKGPGKETLKPHLTHDGHFLYHSSIKIAPFSTLSFFKEKIVSPVSEFSDHSLNYENKYYKSHITRTGSVQIFDKLSGRYLFKEAGNILHLYEDVPMFWDAWDSAYNHEEYEHPLSASAIHVIEANELRKVIEVTYIIKKTKILQRYIFEQNEKTIRIENEIDWHHRRMMLKADFDTTLLCRKASFDLGAGYITRNTHKNTDMEKARFEVPGHRWVDLSERDFGVGILNDGKYGYSTNHAKVSLTLLRSPINPSVYADEGKHSFTYSIMSHKDADNLETIKSARKLNRPLIVFNGKNNALENFKPNLQSENLHLMCLKRTDKGRLVLRVCEVAGSRGKTDIQFKGLKLEKVTISNVLEEEKETVPITKTNSFELAYDPFKIYTFLIN